MSRSLVGPAVLLVVGTAPLMRAVANLDAGSESSRMGLGLALLWLCLMAWIALSRLRALEPRPALRDAEPGSLAADIDHRADRLTTVSSAIGTVLVPVSMILAGRAVVVGSRAALALIALVVALVSAVGALRAVRARLLQGETGLFVGASGVVVAVMIGAAGLAGWSLLRLRCNPCVDRGQDRASSEGRPP